MAEQEKWSRADKGTRLNRWSERKLEVKAQERAALQQTEPVAGADDAARPDDMPDLPDIESLDKDSDFTPFMDARVPEELQRLALRKLWASDPVYANLDGLNDYDPEHMKFLEQVTEAAQRLINEALNSEDAAEAESGADDGQAAGAAAPETTPETAPETTHETAPDVAEIPQAPEDRRHGPVEFSDVEDIDDGDDPAAE